MSNSKSFLSDDVPVATLIRRELFFMIISGLMVSVLIAWATVGLFDADFLVRFFIASAGILSLNLFAYIVKKLRQLK
ncbi:hypothetical protein H4F33_11405 [Pectobacterium brasiliense]|uniref:hypothetical protein n=1 Tax=Pectobacterium brasiliense TaxID=180957 RepID=UPI0015DF3E31|nr:hypothetical protein [Pectobacterium brasiliense]MBA0219605.1 hypothetical protein [Pectobacterium brasiliense]MBN3072710.1 hypothetical protein [Pectobacterium brasiliense]MBN3170696.1 hypothetical protein [Pectobacterium brasiliense]